MLRSLALAFAIMLAPAAYAQDERRAEADLPEVRATAEVIFEALPPDVAGSAGWDAISIRISRLVHWHVYGPDPRDRPLSALVRRHGWIEGVEQDVDLTVEGDDAGVRSLAFGYLFLGLDLLTAVRERGAAVSFQADYETYSEYIVSAPGREPALLTLTRRCTPPGSRARYRCENGATLTFGSLG
ncbi:hypothetical protein [Terricaulis sp.]|uniref:hypothetical protein n=1 Tax=Terricaulis sp. TaxID=2768686 RepID=UPI002AC5C8A5|nr:hypothetical protein [Terricaulis sp.]MDZ4691208.1 hypothetical protein [Terricaulis sp.]